MKEIIEGLAYVLGDSIDTDQMIPAEHLVYSLSDPEERKKYGQYALSGVPVGQQGLPFGDKPFTENESHESPYRVIIGGSNFGCGSAREHAPFALKVAGCEAVVAESFARIFYRNSVDGGFLVPFETRLKINDRVRTGDQVRLDTTLGKLTNLTTGEEFLLDPLGEVAEILKAGNVFEYARQAGFMKV